MKQLTLAAALCGLFGVAVHASAQQPTKPEDEDKESQNPASILETPTTEVVANTPLPSIGIPINQVPTNVEVFTGDELRKQQSTDMTEFLERNVGSVSINSGVGNYFRPDINYRGFQGSALLGVPQGLSAYMDGVRINEVFGDTINWDLIPQSAISSIGLIPGSNPVFGLNTLGGALSINTKSGKTHPGGAVTLQGGSWDRFQGTVELGSRKDNWDFFVTGNFLDENGWRKASSSRIQQLFGKIGYETGDFDADLSYSFADNTLNGTQASPLALLNTDPREPYTYPDTVTNRLNMVNLRLSKVLAADKILSGNIYYRGLSTNGVDSNVNDEYDGSGNPVCDGTDDNPCPGSNESTRLSTDGMGGTLQYTKLGQLFGRENKFIVGTSYDQGKTIYSQTETAAFFTPDRTTVNIAGAETELETSVDTRNRYIGLYITDTFSFNDITHLTLSGRYNRADVRIQNRNPGAPEDDALNGKHTFERFTPAAGLNFNPSPALNTFINISEGMRAPTAVELTCADPNAPCKLPNAFLADPPLKPVLSRTFEIGSRGMLGAGTGYSVTLFRTDLRDDIQFVTASAVGNAGYFQNVGQTRRQGIELGLTQQWRTLMLRGAYSYIDATFQDPFTLSSPSNSTRDANDDIQVNSGDQIPAIPRHNFKLRVDWAVTPRVNLGGNVVYASSQFARGDENNQDVHGKVPSYTLVNLDGSWRITDQWQIFGRVTNVFDQTYETFGLLGQNFFNGPGFTHNVTGTVGPTADQFRTPGLPRAFFVGVRYDFIKPTTASASEDR
jgi:outer membrane receptor protein involved in Fe transport